MNHLFAFTLRRFAIAAAAATALAANAAATVPTIPSPQPTEPPAAAPLTPAPSATTPGAPASAPAPGPAARPFREVVRNAKQAPGFFTIWREDDRTWIEVLPDQIDKPFFFSIVRTRGLGERMVIAGLMEASHMAYFHKMNGHVQLMARNTRFRARAGTPTELAVRTSFSDSLLASAPIASQPDPDTQGILIDANALLLNDIPGAATLLDSAFHIPYGLDGRNSSLVSAEANADEAGFNVALHFAVPRMPALGADSPVHPPLDTPDPRSLFLGYRYNFSRLPEQPMAPRLADERVGYFTTSFTDFSTDLDPNPNVHYINRWRLEKKDPAAALSEPVKPIVFWIDRNIPDRYRQAIIDGVLEWNVAFERIGFKNAIQAKIQPLDAKFDTADSSHATIRWYLSSDGGPAMGPSQVDPRSGEILDADIIFTDSFARSSRRFAVEDLPAPGSRAALPGMRLGNAFAGDCAFAEQSHDEAAFAMDVLEARGDLDPASPQAETFVYNYVRQVVAHEVGHTLGLRHNFRASTAYTPAELADPAFTKEHGITASVMDYAPFNLSLAGQPQADFVSSGLGPYDFWAIEYGYKPLDPTHEKAELARIAERGAKEPWLAYATDEDSMVGGSPQGMDPTVNVWDLSDDPLAYYRKRLALSRELWQRLQTKQLQPGESYDGLRRSFLAGFDQLARSLAPATKYIGGIVQVRDRAGSGRLPYTPVPAKQQREALKILSEGMFSIDSFRFKPQFLASLPYSRLDYYDQMSQGEQVTQQPMISLPDTVLSMQRRVLDQVMSGVVAERVIESQELFADPKQALSLAELYETLQGAIWSELKSGAEVTPMRRNLQREHLRRMVAVLLRTTDSGPADARSLMRVEAQSLMVSIRKAQSKPAYSKETRAHLAESLDTLEQALKAPLRRAAA